MKRLIVITALAAMVACKGRDQKPGSTNSPVAAITQSKNSDEFNRSFSGVLENYYGLKDALVATNDTLAASVAQQLGASVSTIMLSELKDDSSIAIMVKGYAETISDEARALASQKDIETKRKSFQTISDNMYDLLRAVRYDGGIVYHQFCPMAFNDAGAYWLSKTSDIKNPYFGKKMLTCGEVKDSINFAGK